MRPLLQCRFKIGSTQPTIHTRFPGLPPSRPFTAPRQVQSKDSGQLVSFKGKPLPHNANTNLEKATLARSLHHPVGPAHASSQPSFDLSSSTLVELEIAVQSQLHTLHHSLFGTAWTESLDLDRRSFEAEYDCFTAAIRKLFTSPVLSTSQSELASLQRALDAHGMVGLASELSLSFYRRLANSKLPASTLTARNDLADMQHPVDMFPDARAMRREIHLHVGPTNSGKTYHALKRLEDASSGMYAGPLRLLAHEVYTRLNAMGKPCSLVTGDEIRIRDDVPVTMISSTVEMINTTHPFDVAVIDEIQMIGSSERGFAWTNALLGVKAKEVHLCGEERVVPLIRDLTILMGDRLHVHRYERLSPLKTSGMSLDGDFKKLRKGDCLVTFSRLKIHAFKKEVERVTGRRCAIVYGSLPPETRAQQARLFNDPDNDYDILVASDAIGMGLNLSIKRIIFASVAKQLGPRREALAVSDLKQIAGRAGRYRTAHEDNTNAPTNEVQTDSTIPKQSLRGPKREKTLGLVTTLEDADYSLLAHAMITDVGPILTAGLMPSVSALTRFSAYFPPNTPFSHIMIQFYEMTKLNSRFHMCIHTDHLIIADLIQCFQRLTVAERIKFCIAPVGLQDARLSKMLVAFARCVDKQESGSLLDIPEMDLEILQQQPQYNKEYLSRLEALHKGLILYLWLSYRFGGVFLSREMAFHVKHLVERNIEATLSKVDYRNSRGTKYSHKRIEVSSTKGTDTKESNDLLNPDSHKHDPRCRSDYESRGHAWQKSSVDSATMATAASGLARVNLLLL